MLRFLMIFVLIIVVVLTVFMFLELGNNSSEVSNKGLEVEGLPSDKFIQCLVDSGMVVYTSETCPACISLANQFGGYDTAESLFVICGEQKERCDVEMKTGYVPEVQINGELLEGDRTLENFAQKTDCAL